MAIERILELSTQHFRRKDAARLDAYDTRSEVGRRCIGQIEATSARLEAI